ncbi:hypothetical protein Tco_0178597 [Tanacetum coccineum]
MRGCPRYNHKKSQGFITDEDHISDPGADGYDSAHVMIAINVEEVLDCIMDSRVSCNMTYKRDYLFDFEDHDCGNMLLVNGEECRVRKTGNIEKEDFAVKMQSGRIKEAVRRISHWEKGQDGHLGVAGIPQQKGLVEETNVTLLAKVLHKAKFKVEPQEDHTFEVEPQRNVAHIACSQVVQTHNLMNYHSSRERKQHSARELFRYREDNNDVAFAVAKVGKLYAQESLTFSDTVSYEVILEWKVELKEYMDARQVMYVLSNGCKSSDDSEGYYWEYTPAKGNVLSMEFIMDPSDNTLRVSQSNVHNGELVQTLLEGHFILLLEGSLSRDCDVEKNDVSMLDGFYRGLQTHVQRCVGSGYAIGLNMGRSITRSCKRGYLAKGLSKELGAKLKLVVDVAIGALKKGSPWSELSYGGERREEESKRRKEKKVQEKRGAEEEKRRKRKEREREKMKQRKDREERRRRKVLGLSIHVPSTTRKILRSHGIKGMRMDDPNITKEEYIRLEEEKAQKRRKLFNWETAKYDFFKDFENEFPAIGYNDALTSKSYFLTEPTVSSQHIDGFNLKDETSLSECDEKEQNVLNFNDLFPFNVIHPNDSKSNKDNDDDKVDIKHGALPWIYLIKPY